MIAAVAVLWPFVGQGQLQLDLSYAQTLEPWLGDGGAPLSEVSETHVYTTYPAYRYMSTLMGSGGALGWNPMDGLGVPFLAQWHTRALSPFSLPIYALGLEKGLGLSILLKLLVAGLTAYYTARRFGYHAPLAMAVASVYMFSAPLYLWSTEPLGDALPWLPLLLLAGERMALGLPLAWVGAAAGIALVGLAGHPPALTGSVVFLTAYVSLRTTAYPTRVALGRFLSIVPALFVGLAAIAVQLLPYLEYLAQVSNDASALQSTGRPGWRGLLFPAAGGLSDALLFPGFLAPLVLPMWWVMRKYMDAALRARTSVLLGVAVVGLLLTVVMGGLLSQSSYSPWLDASIFVLPVMLALAFVVGAVAEEWILLDADEARDALPRLTKAVPLFWAPYLILVLVVGGMGGVGSLMVWPFVAALFTFLIFGFTLFRPNLRIMAFGIVAVSLLSLLALPAKARTDAANPLPQTAFAASIQEGGFTRIAGSGALERWPLELLGIQQSFAPNRAGLERLAAFQAAAGQSPLLLRRTGAAGLLLTKEDIQGAMSDIRPILKTKAVFEQGAILFEDRSMVARARVIYTGKRSEQPGQAPVSADDLTLIEGATLPEDGIAEPGVARIVLESASEVRVNVPDGPPGILVLADQWYPGWTATVNGVNTPVIPVDATFRGVEIGGGEQEVVFQYRPVSFRNGLIITAIALTVLILGFWRSYAAD